MAGGTYPDYWLPAKVRVRVRANGAVELDSGRGRPWHRHIHRAGPCSRRRPGRAQLQAGKPRCDRCPDLLTSSRLERTVARHCCCRRAPESPMPYATIFHRAGRVIGELHPPRHQRPIREGNSTSLRPARSNRWALCLCSKHPPKRFASGRLRMAVEPQAEGTGLLSLRPAAPCETRGASPARRPGLRSRPTSRGSPRARIGH